MILRDDENILIFSSCKLILTCNDALESEILALLDEISLTLEWSSLPFDVELDRLDTVNMVKSTPQKKHG